MARFASLSCYLQLPLAVPGIAMWAAVLAGIFIFLIGTLGGYFAASGIAGAAPAESSAPPFPFSYITGQYARMDSLDVLVFRPMARFSPCSRQRRQFPQSH